MHDDDVELFKTIARQAKREHDEHESIIERMLIILTYLETSYVTRRNYKLAQQCRQLKRHIRGFKRVQQAYDDLLLRANVTPECNTGVQSAETSGTTVERSTIRHNETEHEH